MLRLDLGSRRAVGAKKLHSAAHKTAEQVGTTPVSTARRQGCIMVWTRHCRATDASTALPALENMSPCKGARSGRTHATCDEKMKHLKATTSSTSWREDEEAEEEEERHL